MSASRSAERPLISVVVPVLNEEASLPELHRRLTETLSTLDGGAEIIYVDDGSTDGSLELIEKYVESRGVDVSLVKLSRNFGMEIAMSAGLDYARGANVALMHADLQDPPELLPEMLAAVGAGADVAYARRIGRDESALKRLLATAFYSLMSRIARVPYQGQAGDFRVMSLRVVEAIRAMPERRRFLRGLVAWVGFEQVPVEYRRAGRHEGRGASYPQLLGLAIEALTAFSDVPLQIATLFGILTAQLSAVGAVRDPRAHPRGRSTSDRVGLGARRRAVPLGRPADHGWDPRAVPRARSRRGTCATALPGRLGETARAGARGRRAGRSARHRPCDPVSTAQRRVAGVWPLGLYLVLSLLLFGLPVLGHLGSRIVASDDIDSSQFMWFFAWWPHALLHGLNPFVTHLMFVPKGFNLTWATAMPGPSIVLAPITLAFSPAVTWNVIQLCAPALSAWTAFLLCRHLTGRVWPSLIGGYIFGFSPYMLLEMTGAPYLTLVALLPVFVLLVLRRVEGSIGRRRFVVAMTAALTGQYLISSEVLASATLFGGIALVLAFGLFASIRPALLDTAKLLVGAYAATLVLISPFLYFFFFGHQYPPGATYFRADLASFVLPPPLVALARQQPAFAGSNTEGYLGLPLIVLLGLFTWQRRRSRAAWLVVMALLVAAALSLGTYLIVRGHHTSIPGPWLLLSHLPVLRYAIALRFAVFVALPAALIVAMWLSQGPDRGRTGIARWGSLCWRSRSSCPISATQRGTLRSRTRPSSRAASTAPT